ncbi:hypothetical protein AB6A40_008600 [Gnathostoma spinigerum]|uniref:Uncharacterized protein n=1 Tax=Gnathostoma spinigerum TaxID=75299 RepID=A0ABD6EPY3_9BILA
MLINFFCSKAMITLTQMLRNLMVHKRILDQGILISKMSLPSCLMHPTATTSLHALHRSVDFIKTFCLL